MLIRNGLLLLTILLSAVFAFAAETPIPSAPVHFVTDNAGFMSPAAREKLDSGLSQYSRQSGKQLIVYIGKTTGDTPLEDWAVKAFEKWKVGQKGLDNGVALFIFSEDRKLRIEVGYGLEGVLPDALANRIINEVIVPMIKAGDNDGAVAAGVTAIDQVISGQGLTSTDANRRSGRHGERAPLSRGQLIFFAIIAIGFLILMFTHPTLAMFLLFSILSGGRGGGGGGGSSGGGFSGGGGRSGGGGASVSW